jgi:hypothetical protein
MRMTRPFNDHFGSERSAGRRPSPTRLRRVLQHLRRDDGVTLIVTLGLMLVASLLVGGAFIANSAEVHLSSSQTQGRKAYYAAQAGISWYLFHLAQNGAYLTYCTEPPGLSAERNPINQLYKAATGREEVKSSELHKISVDEVSASGPEEEKFAVQLIPETSAPSTDEKCDPNKIYETMVEKTGIWKGSFRIRATGFSGTEKRSIVATFHNEGFLDFVYYTSYEEEDPATYPSPWATTHTPAEAEANCVNVFSARPSWCVNIYFGGNDEVKGPMHTEDHVGVIGTSTFGREESDKIEFGTAANSGCGNPDKGYSEETAGTGCFVPTFKGTEVPVSEVKSIQPPPSDNELVKWAENGGLLLKGQKEIILEETNKVIVKTPGTSETGTEYPWPSNGVIYDENEGACNEEYHTYHTFYPGVSTCGDAFVRGKYKRSLTIGAANNIVIDGSILSIPNSAGTPEGPAELGLIANGFVRIYHPVEQFAGTCSGTCGFGCPTHSTGNATNHKCEWVNNETECYAPSITTGNSENPNPLPGTEGTMAAPVIDAGILALGHSFAVDNLYCPRGGAYLGTLHVIGAIAQKYRGIVAVSGGPGYQKNYEYDNRFQAGEPPHFLNPVEAPWKIEREVLAIPPK